MTRYSAFIILFCLRLAYHPAPASQDVAPFTSIAPPASTTTGKIPARLVNFIGSCERNKVLLQWTIDENETADQFEVQKSVDGKKYQLAALVFGTDKAASENYAFYEKGIRNRTSYRLKIINKNKKTEYSPVVEVSPAG